MCVSGMTHKAVLFLHEGVRVQKHARSKRHSRESSKKVNSLVPEKTGAEIHLKAFYSNVSLWSDVIFFREYNRFLWTM